MAELGEHCRTHTGQDLGQSAPVGDRRNTSRRTARSVRVPRSCWPCCRVRDARTSEQGPGLGIGSWSDMALFEMAAAAPVWPNLLLTAAEAGTR